VKHVVIALLVILTAGCTLIPEPNWQTRRREANAIRASARQKFSATQCTVVQQWDQENEPCALVMAKCVDRDGKPVYVWGTDVRCEKIQLDVCQ
jgi:hypothetical protein